MPGGSADGTGSLGQRPFQSAKKAEKGLRSALDSSYSSKSRLDSP